MSTQQSLEAPKNLESDEVSLSYDESNQINQCGIPQNSKEETSKNSSSIFNNYTKVTLNYGGSPLTLETGKMAREADGSVLVTYGNTSVLCCVVFGRDSNSDIYPALHVQYLSRAGASGKIPGGFTKREGKPTERDTLISRLIDRSIRPLFEDYSHNHEVSVTCMLVNYDYQHPPEVPALLGAILSILIAGVPISSIDDGVIAMAHVGRSFENSSSCFISNPSLEQVASGGLDLVVSGNSHSVLMVECGAEQIPEEEIKQAIEFAHCQVRGIIAPLQDFVRVVKDRKRLNTPSPSYDDNGLPLEMESSLEDNLNSRKIQFEVILNEIEKNFDSYQKSFLRSRDIKCKRSRRKFVAAADSQLLADLTAQGYSVDLCHAALKRVKNNIVQNYTFDNGKRFFDDRSYNEIRAIEAELGISAQASGSSLFTRGRTQALVLSVLGTSHDEQIIEEVHGSKKEHFILHYNFLPAAVGETGALRSPSRREIGHGRLAGKAIMPVLPTKQAFPYVIRIVSDIIESDGSSSMATVCGTSLSLFDAGVPLSGHVAGIAMGMMIRDKNCGGSLHLREQNSQDSQCRDDIYTDLSGNCDFLILSDINGEEDNYGQMDFKVAGTAHGITALQMDMKVVGISLNMIGCALDQARPGLSHILGKMNEIISAPNASKKDNVPHTRSFTINKDRVRFVIGAKGCVIKEISEKTSSKIDITKEGGVHIAASTAANADAAQEMVMACAYEAIVGEVWDCEITAISPSFATVTASGKTGSIHISEVSDKRIDSITPVLNVHDKIKAVVISIEKGKPRLSYRLVDQATGSVKDPTCSAKDLTPSPNPIEEDSSEDSGSSGGGDKAQKTRKNDNYGRNNRKTSGGTNFRNHQQRRSSSSSGNRQAKQGADDESLGNSVSEAPPRNPPSSRFF